MELTSYLHDLVRHATGEQVINLHPLRASSGQAALYHVQCRSGAQFALKTGSHLETEARGLHRLAYEGIPCPHVHAQADNYLLMDWLPGSAYMPGHADSDVAETFARMHKVVGVGFGWEETTYVAGQACRNAATATWIEFFRDRRLLPLAHGAHRSGHLPAAELERIDKLAAALGERLAPDPMPRLCHGDLCSGNVLCSRRRVMGLIDPALYFGDPEMDLALFAMPGQPSDEFYACYREHTPLAPDFATRQPLYQLIPLLRTAQSHLAQITRRLQQLGV